MDPRRRFLRVVYLLVIIIAVGIIGYMTIEGWSFLDSLYMTIITLSTVGYAEVHQLSSAGRIFTIVLIIGGVGSVFYILSTIVQYFFEGQLSNIMGRHRMKDKIANLKDHIIVCGYRRVGREVANVFESEGVPLVVVDMDQKAISKASVDGRLYIQGNATSDEVLKQAGINRARALVAALGSDVDNVYIALSAKGIRPNLLVVTRVSDEESESKMRRAGADRIISPHRMAGRRMAMLTLRPRVVDFIDTAILSSGYELGLESIEIGSDSPVAGLTVKEALDSCGATAILAVRKKDGLLLTNPAEAALLEGGDELFVMGTREQLRGMEE